MPVPANKTFTEVRQGLDERIERNDGRTTSAAQRSVDTARAALDKLGELQLSQAAHQCELFRRITGADINQQFVSVREAKFMNLYGLTGVPLVEHLWRELPNSRFKRFQELFSEPEQYAVPRPQTGAPCVQYPAAAELSRCSLGSVIVDAGRIPNKLAQDLSLVSWPDKTPTSIEALEVKAQERVIQGLKAIWESSRPLDARNHRILEVGTIRPETLTSYPSAQSEPEGLRGALLYVREDSSVDRTTRSRSQWAAPHRIAAFFPTVYAALRKTEHEHSGYNAEMSGLSALRAEWETLNERITTSWRRAAPPEVKHKLRAELTTLVAKSREEFESASNHHKKQASQFFDALSATLDSGSNNITAMLARTLAAVRRLDRRQGEVPYKSAFNEADRVQLRRLVEETEHRFNLVHNSLYNASTLLKQEMNTKGGFFNRKDLLDAERASQATALLRRLDIPVPAISQVTVRPFRVFAEKIRENYANLEIAIARQDIVETQRAIVRIVAISKLQQANAAFEQLRRYTNASTPVPLADVVKIAARLRKVLELRSVFPQRLVAEYDQAYQKIQWVTTTMATKLDSYRSKGLDLPERALMYKRLRAYLDKTDVEVEVGKLP